MRSHLQLLVVTALAVAVASPAWAVPAKFNQQGRLLDTSGQPLTGTHALVFALYDASTGGVQQWSESHSTDFDNGYYTVTLGDVTPLDDALFSGAPLWLEIAVDGVTLEPRQEVAAVPWALRATSAESVSGGAVDASNISVAGSGVIDSSGAWVGPAITVDWSNIAGIPADISDGDQDSDSLGSLLCTEGQVAKWASNAWTCADDADTVTSSLPWSSLTDIPTDIADGDQDSDSLGDLGMFCLEGDVPKWLGGSWGCAPDTDTNSQLTEQAVEDFVTNGPLNLASGTRLAGANISIGEHTVNTDTLAGLACAADQVPKWDATSGLWICGDDTDRFGGLNCSDGQVIAYSAATLSWSCLDLITVFDSDGDGILSWLDCDDNDPLTVNDLDCDGVSTDADCDDNDPSSTVIADDADCDGVLTANDCDDNDDSSSAVADDADCDGVLTGDDCDDTDPAAGDTGTVIGDDADCDGILNADELEAVSDCSTVLPPIALDATIGWTVEYWVYRQPGFESSQAIFFRTVGTCSSALASFGYDSSNVWIHGSSWGGGSTVQVPDALSTWTHIAATFSTAGTEVFINGAPGGTGSGVSSSGTCSDSILFAEEGVWFDSMRLSNGILYSSTFVPPVAFSATTDTVGLYEFDGPGVVESDLSGNGNDLTWLTGPTRGLGR